MRKILIWLTTIILLFGVLSGCTSTSTNGDKAAVDEQINIVDNTNYPLTITDYTGKEVTISAEPQRIITFFPSNTEILYELELDEKVIAVTINDDYPLDVQEKVEYVFTDGVNPNIEQALNLDPDLIIFGAHNDELIKSYADLNIPVVKYNPQSIDEVYQTIEDLGVITNTQEEAQQLLADMKKKEEVISNKISSVNEQDRNRVWVEVSSDLWTCGKDTFMNELIEEAGGINIVDTAGWVQYSEENVIEKNPEIIFTTYGYYDSNAVINVLTREGWNGIDAVKYNQVFDIDSNLINRPGPRIIDAIEELAKAMYPYLFEDE